MWMFNIFSAFNFFFSCLIPNFSLPLHPKCVKPHISDIMKIKDILGALKSSLLWPCKTATIMRDCRLD